MQKTLRRNSHRSKDSQNQGEGGVSQKTRKRCERSGIFWYILNALASASPARHRLSPGLPRHRECAVKKPNCSPSCKSQLQPASRAAEKPTTASPPAKCRRDPGRWRPCNLFSQTASFGQTPTELLSPKPRSWPWCRNRPFSTCGGCSWPLRFCAGRWLDFLCEEKERPRWGKAELRWVRATHPKRLLRGELSPRSRASLISQPGGESSPGELLLCPRLQGVMPSHTRKVGDCQPHPGCPPSTQSCGSPGEPSV